MDLFVRALEERAKELNCLYKIEEILTSHYNEADKKVIIEVIKAVPLGCKYPYYADVRITINNVEYTTENFKASPWVLKSDIIIQDEIVGLIELFYLVELPEADEGPFMKEERKLIDTISDRLGHYILYKRLKVVFSELQAQQQNLSQPKPEWEVILDMLKKTDQNLFSIIARKMINHLYFKGIPETHDLFTKLGTLDEDEQNSTEVNRPSKKQVLENSYILGKKIFKIAKINMHENEILTLIQKWMNEEKSHFLVKALASLSTTHNDIADAIRRYNHVIPKSEEKESSITKGIRVSLIRRFLSDQLEFINVAKNYGTIEDFNNLLSNMVYPNDSYGKIGGKASGLFLATRILEASDDFKKYFDALKTPKTWYITSDSFMSFIYYNNFEDVIEQKYRDSDQIRHEYPHIIQAFKNSQFPSVIINGLSRALDDFGDNPIIVRSSSLLEDRMGTAFAGKYKSLFLANQGTKKEKMDALMDAIAEVYASIFSPDPIGYRAERGLLDFNEEMGIMIQEVVGQKFDKYFFPAFAGVAFSNNEFRWSPRIKREDGLIRMVPGLGTRAVDRIPDDHPVLVAPGQSNLRLHQTYQDVLGYAPKSMDVINLETNTFETVSIDHIIKQVGNNYPMLNQVFSIHEAQNIKTPVGLGINTKKDEIVATFENLISNSEYIKTLYSILKILNKHMETPVDIEFACDGKNLYLLQARPQSSSYEAKSTRIPNNVPQSKKIFSAHKFVSNGKVPDIAYIVYVDPDAYSQYSKLSELKDVGKAVGKLNKLLPKKTFILMGPGRWGTRDDMRLGVSVGYSDINNTAVLIEIARKKGNYVPDLSFGTHFFQDLVEASIRYLPLYPDDKEVVFNEDFLLNSENTLTRFLPEFEHIADSLRVINVREATNGMILRIFMNADEDRALAMIADPKSPIAYDEQEIGAIGSDEVKEPLQWRLRMVDALAESIDAKRFGVKGLYLFGTVFNETAGPNSDIDILIRFDGTNRQRDDLELWLEGWNLCLSQINYNKSGYKLDRIIDAYIMTDDLINDQQYYKDMIDISKKAAKQLELK